MHLSGFLNFELLDCFKTKQKKIQKHFYCYVLVAISFSISLSLIHHISLSTLHIVEWGPRHHHGHLFLFKYFSTHHQGEVLYR